MNKLQIKLANKAKAIKAFMIAESQLSASALGKRIFGEIGGSYGVTINPYAKRTMEHIDFRMGFNGARDKSKNTVRGRFNVTSRTRGAFGMTEQLNKLSKSAQKPAGEMQAAA